jgi:O-antigen/teichoic acid export membrane protein
MQLDLLLKALSHTFIGILLIGFLLVLLVSLRKALTEDAPIRGIVQLGMVVLGICTLVALATAYFQAKRAIVPASFSQRLDTAVLSPQQERQ